MRAPRTDFQGSIMRRIPPRTIERQSCDLDCSIEATDSSPERRAILRNLSQTGARLEGLELEGCPDTFALRIVHMSGAIETVGARLIWRKPGAIGIRFESQQPGQRRRVLGLSRAC
jgi:PilZ domain